MRSTNRLHNLTGWLVFAIALTVYFFSAERTSSLWDCGEFILGAYKLQVVHPPGAPFFLLVGRIFTWVADMVSDNPEDIAFSVNLLSSFCTAFAAMFIAWVTIILGKLALVGREEELDTGQSIALAGAGLVAGLATAFATSIWFSAVEGEVYAMSTFFTALTLWSMMKWYSLPDSPDTDRWLLFTVYVAGLSIGVHLLSILTFPALAMFYYFKRYKEHTFRGGVVAAAIGVGFIVIIQSMIIVGIPKLWAAYELMMVNGLGLPFHSGLIPTVLVVGGFFALLLAYLHEKITSRTPLYIFGAFLVFGAFYGFANGVGTLFWQLFSAALVFAFAFSLNSFIERRREVQLLLVGAALVIIGFSTIGVVVVRANADPPINMNAPSDAFRLIPYLNREQYGERALLRGPHFAARPYDTETEDRYGRVGDRYEITDYKVSLLYEDRDKMLFPRIGDATQNREGLYKQWMGLNPSAPLPPGRPNQLDNISFLISYQLGWMYWRYFMWNFSGRQNGEQGFYPWDKSSGHWITGIKFIDALRLGNQDELPQTDLDHKARNTYYALPFIFGLIGLFFHFKRRKNDALGLLVLFVITGIGIIIYSNQPPNEPRERDYVLVGSFFTFCIWIGMAVVSIFEFLRKKAGQSAPVAAVLGTVIVLIAPALMGFENFDDHTRRHHKASRDYASNFLNSCEPNAIIFTYGDNDTYPLWYAQEVEGIRTDVRVVNLSLIAVDWYINLLRRKVNDSPPIKLTIPEEAIRGKKRNQVFYYNPSGQPDRDMAIQDWIRFIGQDNPLRAGQREIESHYQTKNVYIPVDKEAVLAQGVVGIEDTAAIVSSIPLSIRRESLIKDDIAVLDIIASNLWERPVYFAVTCRPEKLFGLADYMQLEGLALRIVPVKSQSDPNYGIIGSGRVDADAVYENVMDKWKWGNFDKFDLFVDRSYMPSVQSIQLSIRRAAFELLRREDNERAIALIDKYFEAFPHMNFPYDYRTLYMLSVYFQAGAYDKAKPHLEILADETADYLAYYNSLSQRIVDSSYDTQFQLALRTMLDIKREAQRANDEEFLQYLEEIFKAYDPELSEQDTIPG
jgi:hypothetical protein